MVIFCAIIFEWAVLISDGFWYAICIAGVKFYERE